MEHLTERDFRALFSFLGETYSSSDFETFVRRVLFGLMQLVPAEFVAYCEMNPIKNLSANEVEPLGAISSQQEWIWERHMHEHPVLAYNARTGDGRALKISDFESQQQFHRRGLYNQLYRPLGVEDVLCMAVQASPRTVIGMALGRTQRNFTERDRKILNLLRPHLAQARHNARRFTRMQEELRGLQGALEGLRCGVVTFDPVGRPRLITPQAERLFANFFHEARMPACGVPASVQNWVRQQLLNSSNVLRPRAPMVVEAQGRRLSLRLLSGSGGNTLILEEEKTPVERQALAVPGLSQRECEVLHWVAAGKTNAEIGSILVLSPRTIQKHLERIFDKLGVPTRTAAASWFLQAQRERHYAAD